MLGCLTPIMTKKTTRKGVKALRGSIWLVMINTFKQLKIIISNLLLPKPALQSNTVFLLLQVVLTSSVLVVVKVSPLLLTDKHGVGVTVVSHDSENRMLVDGYDPAGSYVHNISYLSGSITSAQQVAKLTDISAHCEPGLSSTNALTHSSSMVHATWVICMVGGYHVTARRWLIGERGILLPPCAHVG